MKQYWSGSRFLVEWVLVDDAGVPATSATVTGQVALPGGGIAALSTDHPSSNIYLLGYTPTVAGRHGYELTSTNPTGNEQGYFVVERDIVGLDPITVDPLTDVGYIRLLIADLSEVEPLFEDAQIAAFLAREGNRRFAAAAALEAIATSELLISKKISTQDLSTDGPAVAKELRASAAALRATAATETSETSASTALPVWSFPAPNPNGDLLL